MTLYIWNDVATLKNHGNGTAVVMADSVEDAIALAVETLTEPDSDFTWWMEDQEREALGEELRKELVAKTPAITEAPIAVLIPGSE